jgi:hypothetical protein
LLLALDITAMKPCFFAAVIFPSLMQLHEGISDIDDRRQNAICAERYRRDEDGSKR